MINVEKETNDRGEPVTSVTMTPMGLGLVGAGLFLTVTFAAIGAIDLCKMAFGGRGGDNDNCGGTNNGEEV